MRTPIYTLPHFNLICRSWRLTEVGGIDTFPRILTNCPCQLYVNPRETDWIVDPTPFGDGTPIALLRVPMGTDLQEDDYVEVASGDGWFYLVIEADRVHRGFPNEYFVGYISVVDNAILPGGFLSLEEGGLLLMEDGVSHILLEVQLS